MLTPIYQTLYQTLSETISKDRMFHDPLHTLTYGTDASFYRLIPKIVIYAKDVSEVSLIMREAQKLELPVTFRAAGTSLAGQAISDSILVITGDHWKGFKIFDDAKKISLQPGIIGSRANVYLAPYHKKIGPDPASINSAMIGGIAANNASGMCCGVSDNSYKTVESMKVVFADGTFLDTGDENSKKSFRNSHPDLLNEIENLAKETKNDEVLTERIRHKFKMKNTTGYSLNAFVDYSDPFDIINHIMIGSEGTLGFIAEITYRTVEDLPNKASALMIYPTIEDACNAVTILKKQDVSAVELIDRAGLRSVEDEKGMPPYLKDLSDTATAILVETRAESSDILDNNIHHILEAIKDITPERPIEFTDKPSEYAVYWKIRKGLYPSVGAVRKLGTTVIIEDVAFPVSRLAEATLDLQALFKKHDYTEAVIFGHALDGNLHFVFTQNFDEQDQVDRYERFINDLVNLVVEKYDGALKAEHGTGRNMAPFVQKEWGKDAYTMMQKIKKIFDPNNLLNPGVIINDDKRAHLKNLKPLPVAHELIDKCIECGFCESNCVSHGLTLSPRQRIVAYRHIAALRESGSKKEELGTMLSSYQYQGKDTCATDGLCALACPVKIDTGKFIKELRFVDNSERDNKIASWVANHMGFVTATMRVMLTIVGFFHDILGDKLMHKIAVGIRWISGNRIPLWNKYMPRGAKKVNPIPINEANPKKVVYFPSCINRSMGISKQDKEKQQLTQVMQNLLKKAGYEIIYPERLNSLCCGMPYSSKGFKEQGKQKSDELEAALLKASKNNKYPILCDMSPCLYTMKENMQDSLHIYEPAEFILEYLKNELKFTPIQETVSIFPVCSSKKMEVDTLLVELGELCAKEVIVPDTNCCGFAGDRGFTHPELNAHGLRNLKEQIFDNTQRAYATSRTCEIGLSKHSEINHESIVYLVDEVTEPK